MKRFITKKWKQICSALLILVMMVGIMPQGFGNVIAAEAQSTKLTCLHANYNDNNKWVLFYLAVDSDVTLDTSAIYWSNNDKLNIDGVTVTSTDWYYLTEGGMIGLLVPYSLLGVTSKEELKQETHTFMIPKGEVIADYLTVTEDVYFYHDSTGAHKAQGGNITYSSAISKDSTYRFWFRVDGVTLSSWEYKVPIIIDGANTKEITLCKYEDSLYSDVSYSLFKEGASGIADMIGQQTICIPKGTVLGDIILLSDINLEINDGVVTKGPDVILQPSAYSANSGNAGEINLVMNQEDALSTDGWTSKSFSKGGVSFNGGLVQAVTFSKQTTESKLFTAFFNEETKPTGTIMTLDGDIQEGDYLVRFARTHFKYNGGSGAGSWSNYTPTELSIEGIYQVIPQDDQYLVYLKTSAEVPGNEGHPYPVTVNINGITSTQWAQKVNDSEQNLWLLPLSKGALPETTDNVSITVKAHKELFGTDREGKCEIVNLKSDFTFYYRSNEFAVTELYWLGDANDDGAVDVKDIVRLKLYLNDSSSVSVGKGADADQNNIVNSADYTKLYEYILKGEKVSV